MFHAKRLTLAHTHTHTANSHLRFKYVST